MSTPEQDAAAFSGTLCAGVMIAHQVAARATRDALFLSSFEIDVLPLMLIVSAAASMVVVLASGKLMHRLGPARLVPWSFAASAALILLEWALLQRSRTAAAVAVYLHVAAFGSVLISGFWTLVTECFDPRAAKQRIGRIAGGATLGGLLGGLFAERVAANLGLATMLPILAAMHLFCAFIVRDLRPESSAPATPSDPAPAPASSGVRALIETPYFLHIALLVLLGSVVATFVDYAVKAEAVKSFKSSEDLMRFFAGVYTGVGLLTFLTQTGLSRLSLEKLGLARTVATHPIGTTIAGVVALVHPSLWTAVILSGVERTLSNSLFRSGYELLFTPISKDQKRSIKSLIDVGFERLGNAAGGVLIRVVIPLAGDVTATVLIAAAGVLSLVTLFLTRLLHRGYVRALELSLVNRAIDLDLHAALDSTTLGVVKRTLQNLEAPSANRGGATKRTGQLLTAAAPRGPEPSPAKRGAIPGASTKVAPRLDLIVERAASLRSKDAAAVRSALADPPVELASLVIQLLAWDEVHEAAARALERLAPRIPGQLADALLDAEQDFTIRRRLPRVLGAASASPRAIDALVTALLDGRFEVRYQAGRALAKIRERAPEIAIPDERVYAAVLAEAKLDRKIWDTQRLLDSFPDDQSPSPFVDEMLKDRTSRAMEHVFTLLSLVLPREPLTVAFKGLYTDDLTLRGTALEYLESVLPERIREALWPYLEQGPMGRGGGGRSREQILDELMRSHQSIAINLRALREKRR